jgi:hypothetical protein
MRGKHEEVARRKRIGAGKSRQWCTHEAMCRDAGADMGWSLRKLAVESMFPMAPCRVLSRARN